jgi:hypothetical protein
VKYSVLLHPRRTSGSPAFFQVLDVSRIAYTILSVYSQRLKSKAPSFDVKASIIVCLFQRQNGSTESFPCMGNGNRIKFKSSKKLCIHRGGIPYITAFCIGNGENSRIRLVDIIDCFL